MVLAIAGLWLGFFVAPTDAQQGEGYRIIFVHVPASWMAMFIYCVMAFWAARRAGLQRAASSRMMASALAPTGALFALLSLWTGALWGKPMWGTWWVWDARLTSTLILFFLYLGFIALQAAIDDPRRADKAGAILALVGVVNVPIIYFSVQWWNTLHQGASVSVTKSPSMAQTMLWAHAADGARLLDVRDRGRAGAGAQHHARARSAYRMGAACSGIAAARILRDGRLRRLRVGQRRCLRRRDDARAVAAAAPASAARARRCADAAAHAAGGSRAPAPRRPEAGCMKPRSKRLA